MLVILLMRQRCLLANKSHFDARYCSFGTFISVDSATSVNGLLHGVVSKNTKNNGNVCLHIQIFYSLRYSFANKIKMLGLPLDHATNCDYGIDVLSLQHFFASIDQFKTSPKLPRDNVLRRKLRFQKSLMRPIKQTFSYNFIPFCHNNS